MTVTRTSSCIDGSTTEPKTMLALRRPRLDELGGLVDLEQTEVLGRR